MSGLEFFYDYLFEKEIVLSFQEFEAINQVTCLQNIERGKRVIHDSKRRGLAWFLLEGGIKVYQDNGYELNCHYLFTQGDLFARSEVMINTFSNDLSYLAENDVYVLEINYEKLIKISPKLYNKVYNLVIGSQLEIEYTHRLLLLMKNARERYTYLLSHKGKLFENFLLKDIANYIGVTPESLSRLRRLSSAK